MKKQFFTLFALLLLFVLPFSAQEIEVNGSRKAVRTSGDIGAVLLPVAGLTAVFVQQDWQGLKQGVFSAISTAGIYRRHHLRLEISGKKRPSRPQ